jgi:hypothetical protein
MIITFVHIAFSVNGWERAQFFVKEFVEIVENKPEDEEQSSCTLL